MIWTSADLSMYTHTYTHTIHFPWPLRAQDFTLPRSVSSDGWIILWDARPKNINFKHICHNDVTLTAEDLEQKVEHSDQLEAFGLRDNIQYVWTAAVSSESKWSASWSLWSSFTLFSVYCSLSEMHGLHTNYLDIFVSGFVNTWINTVNFPAISRFQN